MSYTATVTREGDAWIANVDGLSGAHTYARNLTALEGAVDEVIRLVEDLDDDAPVEIRFRFQGLDEEAATAVELADERDELDRRRAALNVATARKVHSLQQRGYSVRDIAGLLHITPGRVSQIGSGELQDA